MHYIHVYLNIYWSQCTLGDSWNKTEDSIHEEEKAQNSIQVNAIILTFIQFYVVQELEMSIHVWKDKTLII